MGQEQERAAMLVFGVATLGPVGLLACGLIWGGWMAAAALGGMTLVVWALDRFIARAAPHVPQAEEFPASERLSILLALVHLTLLPLMVWGLAGGVELSLAAKIALFLGFGLWLGQVSNSNAHEMIHRPRLLVRRLGRLVFISVLYGHHVSAHLLVHHRHVASDGDPNSARRGEGFYRFFLRAWPGEFLAGLRAERRLSRGRLSPYWRYGAGGLVALALAWALGGGLGVAIWAGFAFYAQVQLLLSDYVQHYGLRRRRGADGRLEPVGPRHAWDARHWASSAVMLNAPRHGDHHMRPLRAYPALELVPGGLRLPQSLPVMASLALVPWIWFRVMDRRLPPEGAAGEGR